MGNKITTLFEDETKTNILFPRTKRLAISDENNNPLTEVGFYTVDTVLSGVESIMPGGVTTDLLWTNEAPTSSFAAQTVSLDLTNYGIIIIVFKSAASWGQLANAVITEKSIHRMEMLVSNDYRVRDFTVSNTGIAFGKNQNFRTSTLAWSDDNSCLIPYKIYGIKSANAVNSNTLHQYPDYGSRETLFTNDTSGESTVTGTTDKNGYLQAKVTITGTSGNPFIRIIINSQTVWEKQDKLSQNYVYGWSPLFYIKEGDSYSITLNTDSGSGNKSVYLYGLR